MLNGGDEDGWCSWDANSISL